MPVTKEQQRSAFALEKITNVYGETISKEDANFIVGVPTMILTGGLAQTMAFLLSKQDPKKANDVKEVKLFKIIQQWLTSELRVPNEGGDTRKFLEHFAKLDHEKYLLAQKEALALLQWLKRYARAFQKKEKADESAS